MITIISGTPGSGKTALIVEMILAELKLGRNIYTFGIPKLLVNVKKAGDVKEWQSGTWLQIDRYDPDLTKRKGIKSTWYPRGCPEDCSFLSSCPRVGSLNSTFTPDAGSLLIIDEAHTEFPQRPAGKAPPPYVEALTVHRHQGLDIWFVSQRPSFLDPFVRGLSSRHIHLSLNPFSFTGSRTRYEWSEYQESLTRASKMLAAKSSYKPSPVVFPLYASASVHTKLDQRMPTIMKVFVIMVCILVGMAGLAVSRVKSHIKGIEQVRASSKPSDFIPLVPMSKEVKPSSIGGARSDTPILGGLQQSLLAPVPHKLSSCLSTASKCQCYTDKGVKVLLSDADCRASALAVNDTFLLETRDTFDPLVVR